MAGLDMAAATLAGARTARAPGTVAGASGMAIGRALAGLPAGNGQHLAGLGSVIRELRPTTPGAVAVRWPPLAAMGSSVWIDRAVGAIGSLLTFTARPVLPAPWSRDRFIAMTEHRSSA